jgi:hypothetical protein
MFMRNCGRPGLRRPPDACPPPVSRTLSHTPQHKAQTCSASSNSSSPRLPAVASHLTPWQTRMTWRAFTKPAQRVRMHQENVERMHRMLVSASCACAIVAGGPRQRRVCAVAARIQHAREQWLWGLIHPHARACPPDRSAASRNAGGGRQNSPKGTKHRMSPTAGTAPRAPAPLMSRRAESNARRRYQPRLHVARRRQGGRNAGKVARCCECRPCTRRTSTARLTE